MADFTGKRRSKEHKEWLKRQADKTALEKKRQAADQKYQDDYLVWLEAVGKGEKKNFDNWRKRQAIKVKERKDDEADAKRTEER